MINRISKYDKVDYDTMALVTGYFTAIVNKEGKLVNVFTPNKKNKHPSLNDIKGLSRQDILVRENLSPPPLDPVDQSVFKKSESEKEMLKRFKRDHKTAVSAYKNEDGKSPINTPAACSEILSTILCQKNPKMHIHLKLRSEML